MTHTKYFRRIAEGLDVEPLLQLLDAKPELWKEIEARQKFSNSPHIDTETIFVRGPLKMNHYYVIWDTGSYDYPCMQYLKPALVPLMQPILKQLGVEDMGRVLIVNLKPSGHIIKHIDQGTYAERYQRFHLVLRSNPYCFQTSGSDIQRFEVGETWYMNNKELHEAHNVGNGTDRIHIIFDCVPTVELQY